MAKLRLICRKTHRGAACHVGGEVDTEYKTFVIECPDELHRFLACGQYESAEVIGAENVSCDDEGK